MYNNKNRLDSVGLREDDSKCRYYHSYDRFICKNATVIKRNCLRTYDTTNVAIFTQFYLNFAAIAKALLQHDHTIRQATYTKSITI